MKKKYILLDVGGTEIKGCVSEEKEIENIQICSYQSYADQNQETIFKNLAEILDSLMTCNPDSETVGVGFAFPGPFDYTRGISLMQGLKKYDSIYGISIEKEIKTILPALRDAPFTFVHDVEAFALGENYYGAAKGGKRVFCLCIGTGAGSVFLENGRAVKKPYKKIPENGWIYSVPYRKTVIDDYLSVRGLAEISRQVLGIPEDGQKLAEMAQAGDQKALEVWHRFGKDFRDATVSFLDSFLPDTVIVGGQISKSFELFGEDFKKECNERQIRIFAEPETSVRTVQGLLAVMTEK